MLKFYSTFTLLLSALFLTSCLQTDPLELEKRVIINYSFDGLNTTFTSTDDTLDITRVKVFSPRFWVITSDQDSLNSNVPFVLNQSREEFGASKEIINATIGFSGFTSFDDFRILITEFDPASGVSDADLNNNDDPLSIYLEGTYNGQSFTYESAYSFDLSISYPEVNLTDDLETLDVDLIIDATQWFENTNQSGDYLDPLDQANAATIDQQIEGSFSITARRRTALDDQINN